jgi:hypothetical protein
MPRKNWHRAAFDAKRSRDFNRAVESGQTERQALLGQRRVEVPREPDERRELAGLCLTCSQPGHFWRSCPETKCHGCGGFGHIKRNCPQGKQK